MYNATVSLVESLRNIKWSPFREHKNVHMWKLKQPKEKHVDIILRKQKSIENYMEGALTAIVHATYPGFSL